MWAFKVLPALFGLGPWFKSALPASNIEVVIVTQLVFEAPLILPTVTVTETIGIPATAITHAIPTTSPTSSPESRRSNLNPYKYPSPVFTASRLQNRVSAAHAIAVPQHSKFEFAVFVATIFAVAIMTWWVTIFSLGKNRAMRNLEQIPSHVNASFQHTGCRIGYGCALLAWIGLLCDYWIGWSDGYVVWPKILSYFLSYPLILVVHSQLPVKRIPLLCGRFVKKVVNGVGHWLARQATEWYEGRTSKRRIDRIFERPIAAISIGECLFPDTYDAFPNNATFSQILKAFATDVLFFGWNLILVVVKLRIRSWKQIPVHIMDIVRITVQVLFGFGQEELSWKLWLGLYETFLKAVCTVFSVTWGLIRTFLGAIWVALEMGKAMYNRICACIMTNRQPDGLTKREVQSYEDKVHNAYCETSTYNWSQTALLYLQNQATLEDNAALWARIAEVILFYSSLNSCEIGKKCVGYRDTIIELIHDVNYLRNLCCSMLNAQHNRSYGLMPNDTNAKHPFQPSQLEFRTMADPKTGLYFGYKEHTVSSINKHNLGREFEMHVKHIAMDYEKEPLRMSGIISCKTYRPGNVPDRFDPFLKDHWVILGVIPGVNIPPYTAEHNPFDIRTKRVRVIVNPESHFGPQIEDFAAKGRLAQWGDSEAMQTKVAPFDRDEISKFLSGIQSGAEPLRQPNLPSLPKRGAYSRDPCPTGEPRKTDYPLYKKFA